MALEIKHFYDFGNFRLDLAEKVLLRDGKPQSITPKVFHLLKILVENHGRIVEKEKLIGELWADSIVEEGNLAFNARMLRKALGDDAAKPTFIETVPRRGYRFIAEVTEKFDETDPKPSLNTANAILTLQQPKRTYLSAAILLIFLTGSIVVGSWYLQSIYARPSPAAPILSAPFKSEKISTSGSVALAVVSPDGKYAAYTEETNGKYGVWLRQLETAENIQIVPPSEEVYGGMAFSHDGNSLYFMRKPRGEAVGSGIYRVMTFGGIAVKILDRTQGWMSISPDDKQISFVRCEYKDDDFCSLFVADVDGKNERKILTRASPIRISSNDFSPDGKSIAFAVGQSWNGGSDFRLKKVDLESGTESEITPKTFFEIKNVKWLPHGDGLLFTAKENLDEKTNIWQISAVTGETQIITNDAANYNALSLDKKAARMIATQVSNDFRLHLSSTNKLDSPKILTKARDLTFAPDGRIIYSIDNRDIWAINADGSGQRQLTNNSFCDFHPKVSPDNRFIFFTSNRTGANQIWRMNADGSSQMQLTRKEGGYAKFATPDGKWVYYTSSLHRTLWKVSAEGGEETQVLDKKMSSSAFSPDGSLIAYFFRDKELKIGVMSFADKKQIKVVNYGDGKSSTGKIFWSSDNRTLNFITRVDGKNSLWQQSLDEDQPRFIADLGDEEIADFALAPDGRSIAFIRGKWLHDAVLIDGLK